MRFTGYRRPDGRIGVRNHVVVIAASVCASEVAVRICAAVPGTIALPHTNGCCQIGTDYDQTVRTLVGLGRNPNVGAVLVVALGCEGIQADTLVRGIRTTRKPVESVSIQETGGTDSTVRHGTAILKRLKTQADRVRRTTADLSDMILGLECGGSDATSGIVANPVMGLVSDRLIAAGGTSILSETTELIGAEHVLVRRARDRRTARRLLEMVRRTERRALDMGVDIRGSQPTPGNIAGGITTIEEKSLGCLHKAGSAPVRGVLEYAECPRGRGLYVMDTPGQDIESITGMAAGGAQVIIFSTGRGTPTGCPIAPVIKITGNSRTYRAMRDDTDINAGVVIDEGVSLDSVAEQIFREMIRVCGGRKTRAEINGHNEFAIFRVGYTF